jgi:S1-C subfamily serine protease
MANALKELSNALREAIKRASAFTVSIEHEPYAVSGVLIDAERVLTASHLVPDEGIRITLPDGTQRDARLLGRDSLHDLALLRLSAGADTRPLQSSSVSVGDLVISLKRDPIDGINASLAMISASGGKLRLGRGGVVERYLQMDSDRLPGTTGGPLVDAEGALVAIQTFNGRMGGELAIPADLALERARLLAEKGSIKKPYLGIRSQAVSLPQAARDALKGRQDQGLLLVWVDGGSSAERAGLEVGDILVGFAGKPVSEHEHLVTLMAEQGAGAVVEVEAIRGGTPRKVSLTIGGA